MTTTVARCAIEYDTVPPALWFGRRRRRAEDLAPGTGHRHFALGRSALLWLCRSMGWGPGDRVLVPSFICESVSDPFLAAGLTLDFYGVNADLSVDLDDLRKRLPGAVGGVLIHYFGWPQTQPVREWLASRTPEDGFWIEDLTHSLYTRPAAGPYATAGDAVLLSYRKLFPCAEGCVLSFNRGEPGTSASYEGGWRYGSHGVIRYGRMALTGLLGKGRRRRGKTLRRFDAALRHQRIHPPIQVGPMSGLTRRIVERFDIDGSSVRRRLNAVALLEALQGIPGIIPLFTDLSPGIVPGLLPIRILGGRRDAVREYLDERGVEAHFHWRRPPGLALGQHPVSDRLREEQLSLPLDERYGSEDMRAIAQLIRDALRDTSGSNGTHEGGVHAISR